MTDREQLEEYLKKEGFEINFLGGRCPFQIEANHQSGISVYFRARGERARLEVYNEHFTDWDSFPDDDQLLWVDSFECWDEYEAGWIDDPEAFYVFYSLWTEAKNWVFE